MTFQESVRVCLSKYADFSGRASRSEYWWFFLFIVLVGVATSLVSDLVSTIFLLGTLLPSFSSCFWRRRAARTKRLPIARGPPCKHPMPVRSRPSSIHCFPASWVSACSPPSRTASSRNSTSARTSGGVLHGGAYMAFADTLGAVGTFLNLPQGSRTTTTDSSTKFIAAAAVNTTVVGESIALHRGRTTMVWQTMIKRADGKLCAVVTQTQLVIPEAT